MKFTSLAATPLVNGGVVILDVDDESIEGGALYITPLDFSPAFARAGGMGEWKVAVSS